MSGAQRHYFWRRRFDEDRTVPARQLLAIVHEGLDRFREWNADMPLPDTTTWIVECDRWLAANRLKIQRLIGEEEHKKWNRS